MTQFQFDMIIKIIKSGAPAVAEELCEALNNLVNDRNMLYKENELLKTEFDEKEEAKSE